MKQYIAIEGNDGTGKSTLIEALAADIKDGVFTCEPGSKIDDWAANMRKAMFSTKDPDILALQLAMIATRLSQFSKIQREYADKVVVTDRCWLSTFVYHAVDSGPHKIAEFAEYLASGDVWALEAIQLTFRYIKQGFFPVPNLIVVLRAEVATLMKRIGVNGEQNHYDHKDEIFFQKINMSYEYFAYELPIKLHAPRPKVVTIDIDKMGTGDVYAAVKPLVAEALAGKFDHKSK